MMAESVHDREMPFIEHLRELRRRVIVSLWGMAGGFVVALIFYDDYVRLLVEPYGEQLYLTRIEQAFMLKIQISLYAGLILSFPLHLFNVVAFILPALTDFERRLVGSLLGASTVLAGGGAWFGYVYILPLSIRFLKSEGLRPEGVEPLLGFREAVFFVLQMLLGFIAAFQLPLIMLGLMGTNIVSRATFLRLGRYVVIVIFIGSALLTPPDVVSQVGLAVPLILLYYLAILVAKGLGLGKHPPT